jgi:hypothetical protein
MGDATRRSDAARGGADGDPEAITRAIQQAVPNDSRNRPQTFFITVLLNEVSAGPVSVAI